MKPRFLVCAALLVIGAVLAGYSSGYYQGVRTTRMETQYFLREFSAATDLDSYLQQRGQKEWSTKLAIYGIGGPTSYIHARTSSSYSIMMGIACVAVGVIGLLPLARSRPQRAEQAGST